MVIIEPLSKIGSLFGYRIYKDFGIPSDTSANGEQNIIKKYLDDIEKNVSSKFVIDIGASDGVISSNTYPLYYRGYKGLCVEADPVKLVYL